MDCSDITTPINNLWSDVKTICLDNLRKHVPSKHTSTRYSQPWCNRNIRRLSRRKQRAFNKYRKTGKKKDWDRYRQLQKSIQKECKSSYNEYVNDMVSQDSGNKKLFYFRQKQKVWELRYSSPEREWKFTWWSEDQSKTAELTVLICVLNW